MQQYGRCHRRSSGQAHASRLFTVTAQAQPGVLQADSRRCTRQLPESIRPDPAYASGSDRLPQPWCQPLPRGARTWKKKAASIRAEADAKRNEIAAARDAESRQVLHAQRDRSLAKADWLDSTIVEIIISVAQNEVADFKKWGFDIIPIASA